MSFSVFYAVRFSPAPELGEWLNVAVVGEDIAKGKAGIVVADSLQRIEAAFGTDAVERVKAISEDLTNLVASMASAHDRGEETQPIPTAMRDQALSLSFSEQIVVFEGTFESALAAIAKKYLTPIGEEETEDRQRAHSEQDSDLARVASVIQNRLARFSREIFPATMAKSLEQGQKAIESIVHGPDVKTVLVIGGVGHLESALLPKLLESGKKVRLFDPSISGSSVIEILHPDAIRGPSIADVAKRAGVSAESVTNVLEGATEKLRISPKTVEKIKDIAVKLGYSIDATSFTKVHSEDVASSMEDVDAVIYIPDTGAQQADTAKAFAQMAKIRGVKRFVYAGACRGTQKGDAELETDLHNIGDGLFGMTILRLGELYGHASTTEWFGDLHNATPRPEGRPTVNVLTAQAIVNGKVSIVDTGPHPYLHVEDAVESIIAVIDARADIVNGQVYDVGSDEQVRTVSEIARLIKQQAPNAEFVIAKGESEAGTTEIIFSKIDDELGFAPARTLEEGISQLIAALRDGRVSSYMSVRAGEGEVRQATEAAPQSTSEIRWDSLTYTSIDVKTEESVPDQSRQKH